MSLARKAAAYFADNQHTTKAGARLNAEVVAEGLKQLKDCKLADDLTRPSPSESAQPDHNTAASAIRIRPRFGARSKGDPIPQIQTSLGTMPGVDELPVRTELPDVLTMNDGTKVTTLEQWKQRREEMKRILEYYAVGLAPPPPGNVKGAEVNSQIAVERQGKVSLGPFDIRTRTIACPSISAFSLRRRAGHFPH